MRVPKKNSLTYFVVTAIAVCTFCAIATCATAAPVKTTVSLAQLSEPVVTLSSNETTPPGPSTPFTPAFFGSTVFPSNGNNYTKGGSSVAQAMAGLESRGPHGGYDTATAKCGVCHSAHSANGLGEIASPAPTSNTPAVVNSFLTRAGTTGCEYCHVGSTGLFSNAKVYTANDGDVADLGTGNSGHAITGKPVTVPASDLGTMTLSCASCHTIHGVNSTSNWMPTDFFGTNDNDTAQYGYKLLVANPSGGANPVPNTSTMTVTKPGLDPKAVNQFALSAWCANCHNETTAVQAMATAAPEASEETTFSAGVTGNVTHTSQTIGTTASSKVTGPHYSTMMGVGAGAPQCYTCHRGGNLSAEVPIPSTADAAKLTALGYTPPTDPKCSLCHYGTADFALDPARLNYTSDWPHSSTNDVDMLGNWSIDSTTTPNAPVVKPDTTITAANSQEMVCGRCHPVASKTATTITYNKSLHVLTHSYPIDPLTGSWETSHTVGTLTGTYSPGF